MTDIFLPRPRCATCALPLRTCLCALVTPVRNELEVLVLQHPHEVDEAKGSARLLRLSLARCRVVVGEVFEPDELLALLGGDVSRNTLLYPSDTAEGMSPGVSTPRPDRLVLLDATWRKSLRMLHGNPLLQSLPRWDLAQAQPSRYAALRKARQPGQLSTLEAACAALAGVEADSRRYRPLLDAFDRFVTDRAARAPVSK
jgi:DTW domain-containing protein YfiP